MRVHFVVRTLERLFMKESVLVCTYHHSRFCKLSKSFHWRGPSPTYARDAIRAATIIILSPSQKTITTINTPSPGTFRTCSPLDSNDATDVASSLKLILERLVRVNDVQNLLLV